MKKNVLTKWLLLFCLTAFPFVNANAYGDDDDSGIFWGFRSSGGNFWSASYLALPTNLINTFIPNSESASYLYYSHVKYENENGKMNVNQGNWFGFKSKDMFANVRYGFHVGWQPKEFPFGVYVSGEYGFNKFRLDYDDSGFETKFKFHSVQPGIGVRLAPLAVRHDWTPILDVSMIYNYTFSLTGPFNNDKSQINNGIRSHYGIGARFGNTTIVAGFEKEHYNRFNQDFTPDGGVSYPYKNVKSKAFNIFLNLSLRLDDDD